MYNIRNRPKGKYIKQASWNDLFILTEHWKNDLDFYLFEMKFLESLIEKHFSKLLLCENLDELRELQRDTFDLRNQCEYIQRCIKTNLESIVDIINNTYIYNTEEFRIENEQLEDDILEFINNEREMKRVIYSMIKDILENEKPKQVWMFN
ncbi:hypothetical protein [Changchengzhania lutea]|uniref:hypothetical protein n=1 Tax=Changchengzhania lutea TaxID=2049305 RepID=UPI00115E1A72|nr:hypothetical protein [Changchengzhania lutea]